MATRDNRVHDVGQGAPCSMAISSFPVEAQEMLKTLDIDGDGTLDGSELTPAIRMHFASKNIKYCGTRGAIIPIDSLPESVRETLKTFDLDGDGTLASNELARAAELYKESQTQVKRLRKIVVVLFAVLVAVIGVIVALTAVVVEESKESKVSSSGVQTVKGGSAMVATGIVTSHASIFDALSFQSSQLKQIKQLDFSIPQGVVIYDISGSFKNTNLNEVTFHTHIGATIVVSEAGLTVNDPINGLSFDETRTQTVRRRRALLQETGSAHGVLTWTPLTATATNTYVDSGTAADAGTSCAFQGLVGECDRYVDCLWNATDLTCKKVITTTGEGTTCRSQLTIATCDVYSDCMWDNATTVCMPYSTPASNTAAGAETACSSMLTMITCGDDADCLWNNDDGMCLPASTQAGTACSSLMTNMTCSGNTSCVWNNDDGMCLPTSTPAGTASACSSMSTMITCGDDANCLWNNDSGMCKPANETAGTACSSMSTMITCGDDANCLWDNAAGMCLPASSKTSPTMAPTMAATLAPTMAPTAQPLRMPLELNSAGDFVILTKTGITSVPTSHVSGGAVGTSPITGAALGLSCTEVTNGTIYTVDVAGPDGCSTADATMLTLAIGAMEGAYTTVAGITANVGELSKTEFEAGDISGLTLLPGVYKWSSAVSINTDVTLKGDANSVWIFQIAQTLTLAVNTNVILSGGAQAKNIFWQAAGDVTLGVGSHFEGTVLTAKKIAMGTGASINGRLLAQTAVTLQSNDVTMVVS